MFYATLRYNIYIYIHFIYIFIYIYIYIFLCNSFIYICSYIFIFIYLYAFIFIFFIYIYIYINYLHVFYTKVFTTLYITMYKNVTLAPWRTYTRVSFIIHFWVSWATVSSCEHLERDPRKMEGIPWKFIDRDSLHFYVTVGWNSENQSPSRILVFFK